MKLILLLLLIPFFSYAQTVHIEKGKIEYQGTAKLKGISQETLYERAKNALLKHVNADKDENNIDTNEKGTLKSNGKIRLSSPYSIIRTVHYTITINIDDGEYKYKIDSVFIKQKERGGKTKVIPSEDLVKDMETSGNVAIDAEKQLNEIDMKFQKLIFLINSTLKNHGKLKSGKNKNKV